MNAGVFMAGESDEANLALLFGFGSASAAPPGADEQLGIVVEGDTVNLPEIEVIGLQPLERLLEHLHGESRRRVRGCRPWS